jgi:hypothetical protein
MIGILPEGISDIIQNELKKIDLVRKDDIENLFKNKNSSSALIDKDEWSRLVADSISEFKITLMGLIKKNLESNGREEKQRSINVGRTQEVKEVRTYSQQPKFNKFKKKVKGKNNKFKKFDPKKKRLGPQERPQQQQQQQQQQQKKKPIFEKKHEHVHTHPEKIRPDSPVGMFLRSKNPQDKMQELKCLAFYLDQIDRLEVYNVRDFHNIYKRANLKVPPVFDTLLRFLIKSNYLIVTENKKEGFNTWKITDKVIRELG